VLRGREDAGDRGLLAAGVLGGEEAPQLLDDRVEAAGVAAGWLWGCPGVGGPSIAGSAVRGVTRAPAWPVPGVGSSSSMRTSTLTIW
jgi:hypothetical protein